MDKSPAWWTTAPSADIIQKYEAAGVPFLRTEGILNLKVPVCSDTYMWTQLVNKVEVSDSHAGARRFPGHSSGSSRT
jgi:hypothetical protein